MSRFLAAFAFAAALVPVAPASLVQAAPAAAASHRTAMPVRVRVRQLLAAARLQNLARFHVYAEAGVFPNNVYGSTELNVWRDQDGHYCAAANLVRLSGYADLAKSVGDTEDFVRLGDVKDGPLMSWILTSGFTQDEIALIQRPYEPVADHPVPAPKKPVPVDSALRTAETARLRGVYATIEKQLARDTDKSLDLAVDRLMARPDLVAQLLPKPTGGDAFSHVARR